MQSSTVISLRHSCLSRTERLRRKNLVIPSILCGSNSLSTNVHIFDTHGRLPVPGPGGVQSPQSEGQFQFFRFSKNRIISPFRLFCCSVRQSTHYQPKMDVPALSVASVGSKAVSRRTRSSYVICAGVRIRKVSVIVAALS